MQFLEPISLVSLSIPLLLLFVSLKKDNNKIEKIFAKDVLQKISLYPNLKSSSHNYKLFLLAISLFIISLSKPTLNSKYLTNNEITTPLLIALDISNSMNSNDIYPSRFSFALKKIYTIVDMHPNMRLSLLLFSRNAYLAYPMSEDLNALKYILKNIDKKLESGSNIFSALEGAKYILKPYSSKNILLLSDGASSSDFNEEEHYLRENNITLNALYINKNKNQMKKIKELCLSSRGTFSEYSFSNIDIRLLLHEIQKHAQSRELKENDLQNQHKIQLFYYPLALGVILILFIFLQKYEFKIISKILSILYASIFITQVESHAGLLDFKKLHDAKKFYEKKEYLSAIQVYKTLPQTKTLQYNLANSLYKNKEYKKAISIYKTSFYKSSDLNASIYYNIANAYFYLQKFSLAKKHYIKSLKIKDDIVVQENLNTLLLFMKTIRHKKKDDKYKLPKNMSSFSKEIPEITDSRYRIKLKNVVPSEEDRWMKIIQNDKPTIFLQKLNTKRMSKNVNDD